MKHNKIKARIGDSVERTVDLTEVLSNVKITEFSRLPDPKGRFLLHDVMREKNIVEFMVTELLKYDIDRSSRRNESGCIPLHVACINIEQVRILLKIGFFGLIIMSFNMLVYTVVALTYMLRTSPHIRLELTRKNIVTKQGQTKMY